MFTAGAIHFLWMLNSMTRAIDISFSIVYSQLFLPSAMRLSFRLISFLLAISACTLIVEVDVPYKKDVAVINAIGAVDSLWTVNLTRSKFILDTLHSFYFQVIDDAD